MACLFYSRDQRGDFPVRLKLKTLLHIAASMALCSSIALAQDLPTEVESLIKEKAAERFPDDFSMQKYVIDEQVEAYGLVEEHASESMSDEVFAKVKEKALQRFPDDFAMQKYILDEQEEAHAFLQSYSPEIPHEITEKIRKKAAGRFPLDFAMQKYVTEEQVEAYIELQ